MFGVSFRKGAVLGRNEILGWPGEDGGEGRPGSCGIVFGGDVEGEVEEGMSMRNEVGGEAGMGY